VENINVIQSMDDSQNEDELIRLVNSNADASTQYVLFRCGNDELFAINVAKVEELMVYKSLTIAKSSESYGVIIGVSKIRDNMTTIVNFDRWLGKGEGDEDDYELVMLCSYGGKRVAIMIKSVVSIMNIEAELLHFNTDKDEKTAYISEINIDGMNQLCIIFDSDRFLLDIFPEIQDRNYIEIESIQEIETRRKVFIVEDSHLIQNMIRKTIEKMGIECEVFKNGKEVMDALSQKGIDIDDIGLIITDIEMPVMDGLELLSKLQKDKYKIIPVVVNTNMANPSIAKKSEDLGAKHVIYKLDINDIEDIVIKYIRD
jgi:two-component system, chemotaxis family, chemotaxis protein CheV